MTSDSVNFQLLRNVRRWLVTSWALAISAAPVVARAQTNFSNEAAARWGLTNEPSRLGYALGIVFGDGMKHEGFEVDFEAVSRGMKDSMTGTNTAMSKVQARAIIGDCRKELEAKAEKERLELARRNRAAGKAFCETNAYREGVTSLPSGLQFRVLRSGDGPLVDTNLIIKTYWRGSLVDGSVFYDTHKNTLGSEFRFASQFIIKGLREALPMMHVGDRWEIVIPADLAYGDTGYINGAPPGATLIYDLELLSAKPPLVATGAAETTAAAGQAKTAPEKTN